MECLKYVEGKLPNDMLKGTIQIQVGFSGRSGGKMGVQWHQTSRRMHIFVWKWE
jgi:hypothetical protein